MVEKDKLVRIALILSAIGILGDMLSTYIGLTLNPDLREGGFSILFFIQRFGFERGLERGLVFSFSVNAIITFILYIMYKYEGEGQILWVLSFLRIWVVIHNLLFAFGVPFFLITIVEWGIVSIMSKSIFDLLSAKK